MEFMNWHQEVLDWKDIYVIESNKIDPQPGYSGNYKGCQMFDNHTNALNFAISCDIELKENTPLDIHRFLTKGIPFFENVNMSGQYRTCSVWIGGHECPKFNMIPHFMNQWFNSTLDWMNKSTSYESAVKVAWASHNMFEVIHPFIDGNGRTGRLIFNKVLVSLGYDPVIFFYDDVESYYDCIQNFRDLFWAGMNFDFKHLDLS